MPSAPARARRRNRTFDGCATCRARKVKCDGRRPACTQCEKRRVECAGFDAKIQYVFYDSHTEDFTWPDDTESPNKLGTRRPLYSDGQRANMSSYIASTVAHQSLDILLNEADFHRLVHCEAENFRYYPFGLMDLNVLKTSSLPDITASTFKNISGDSLECDTSLSPLPSDLQIDRVCSNSNAFAFLAGLDSSVLTDALFFDSSLPSTNPDNMLWQMSDDFSSRGPIDVSMFSPRLWNVALKENRAVPHQASFLLEHYKQQMISLFSPKGGKQPPWGILHLPNALSTLSDLTVHGSASHAKISLLYSLLAVSAFNLDRMHLNDHTATGLWWRIGNEFAEFAKQEVKRSLASEISGPRKSKYKDILMAMLTMVTIAVVSGRQDDARSFLLDAEHFVLIRGIEKPLKSRKVNLLHQIYLFLRVVEESTHVYPHSALALPDVYCISETLSPDATFFPSLRTQAALSGRHLDDMTKIDIDKELVGELQLGVSLFEEVYGIPLELISLLSRTTWLANELWLHRGAVGMMTSSNILLEKAKRLEDEILAWAWNKGSPEASAPDGNNKIMYHLIHAIHDSLILFFYRRIYDLNPAMLQSHVEEVAQHLFLIEQEKITTDLIFNGIAWPGFIAAAEALDPHIRQQLSTWLRSSAESSGFRNFDVAADVAEQVWLARQTNGPRMNWVELVRTKQLALVLT